MFPDVHTNKFLADIACQDWLGAVGALQIVPKLPPGPEITEKKNVLFQTALFLEPSDQDTQSGSQIQRF